MILTDAQRVAITHPAIVAMDCAHERYVRVNWPWSVLLTVNSGFE